MIPVFGLLSAVLTAVGGYSLYWYHSLSESDRAKADQIALQYAQRLYSCGLDSLPQTSFAGCMTW